MILAVRSLKMSTYLRSYYDLVITTEGMKIDNYSSLLTEFKITGYNEQTKEATVFATQSGRYSLIFADYENTRLANVDIVEYDFEEGINVVPQEVTNFTLASDDKVMLWYDMVDLVPVCEALTIN